MAYSLTVLLPDSRGPEFSFDSEEVRLGRTADNDIVVKDPNASRAHCRVYVKDGQHWLEDLMSANGTTVNGKHLQGAAVKLAHGDTLSIGEVSFTFAIQKTKSLELPRYDFGDADTVVRGGYGAKATDRGAAVIKTHLAPAFDPKEKEKQKERERSTARAAPVKKPAPPPPEPEPAPARTEEVDPPPPTLPPEVKENAPASTAVIAQVAAPAPPQPTNTVEVRPPSPLPVVQPPEAERAQVRRGKDKPPEEDSELFEPTAAQKARIRRSANKTALGRIAYGWRELALKWRAAMVLATVAVFGGIGLFAWTHLAGPPGRVLPAEPTELVSIGQTVEYSFGSGAGVDYERVDLKAFDFKAVSATRLVGLLHYQARDIGKDEVAILLNGQDLGFVPPDSSNTTERELEVVLPADQIKRNEPNQLVFDNVRNPPGREGWAVWNLWLQLLPLPDLSPAETPVSVQEDLARAQKFYELREIVPDALFNAWRAYRDAWLKLESMPGRPNDLYAIARGQQAEAWRLLDRRCRLMQIDVQRALTKTKPDYKTARVVLKDMLRYFPTREHPCNGLVNGMIEQLEK